MAIETAPASLSDGQYQTATGVFLLDPLGNPLGTSATYPLYVTGGGSSGGGGAVTQSTGAGASAPWSVEISNGSAFNSASAPLFASITNLPGTQAVSGTVSVGNFPATQSISGSVAVSNLPATQPVSGSVSVSNLPTTQTVSGTVAVSNFPATQTVADTNSAAFQGVVAITPGTAVAAARSLGFVITTAGTVTLTLANGSTLTIALPVAGFSTLPFAVTNITLGTGTAGSFWNLV